MVCYDIYTSHDIVCPSLSLSVPGPVSNISSVSSFFMITITWEVPEMPNGIITGFEVVYGLAASPQSSRTENVTANTRSFTTPDDLERGTEYTFTVTARTSVGLGNSTSINVFTLGKHDVMYVIRCQTGIYM